MQRFFWLMPRLMLIDWHIKPYLLLSLSQLNGNQNRYWVLYKMIASNGADNCNANIDIAEWWADRVNALQLFENALPLFQAIISSIQSADNLREILRMKNNFYLNDLIPINLMYFFPLHGDK